MNAPCHAQTTAAQACVGITEDAARLACYDSAYGRTVPAREPLGAPTASTPTPPSAVDRFGDNGQLAGSVKAQAAIPKSLSAQIAQLTSLPNGLYRLVLDNQQTWQTTQADWALDFKTGDRVTLTKMALGGYQVSLAGRTRSIGARRLQ